MKLWRVANIIGMSIHKELLIAICTMQYVAISIRVCEIPLWRPLRHATGSSEGCRSEDYQIDSPRCPSVARAVAKEAYMSPCLSKNRYFKLSMHVKMSNNSTGSQLELISVYRFVILSGMRTVDVEVVTELWPWSLLLLCVCVCDLL